MLQFNVRLNYILTAVKREKFAKKKGKYAKGKLVTFSVKSLILYQYPSC